MPVNAGAPLLPTALRGPQDTETAARERNLRRKPPVENSMVQTLDSGRLAAAPETQKKRGPCGDDLPPRSPSGSTTQPKDDPEEKT